MISRFDLRGSFCFAFILLSGTLRAPADVKLHGLFSDNMVLQRDVSVPIWGWADNDEEVTIRFRDQKVVARAKDGKWMARLQKARAGGPDELKITGKNSIVLNNVFVGEVWIASGQSNMEWPMRASYQAEQEIPATGNAMLHLYTVPKLKANEPQDDVNASWQECHPGSTSNFSAVAYYFARDLQKALKVPVGIIHTSWGGSPAEVWMSERVLGANPDYKRDILEAYVAARQKYQDAVTQFEQEEAEAKKEGKPFTKRRPSAGWKPAELYNGMIAPLIPYAIKGAIWYQGESNAGRAHQYRTLFPDMIRNWRHDWGQGDFAFLEVQLAPFMQIKPEPGESSWAELREAQLLATKALPNVGMAVITDVGDEKDIHPKKKEPVGARLALAARAIAYGEDIVYSGPTYKSMKVKDDTAILRFNHVGSGLAVGPLPGKSASAKEDKQTVTYDAQTGRIEVPLTGFAIAGDDKKFVWATAEVQDDKVVVSSPQVQKPVAVRYGWADCPVVNLWNKEGLPASPFRTDDFPMVTQPKR